MRPMTVSYARPLAITELVVGVLLLLVSLIGAQWIGVVAGAVLALVGGLQMVNPILRVDPDEVRVCNPLGMTVRRFPVSSPADLRFDGKALRHVPKDKKIATLGFGFDKDDVAALRAQVQTPA
ncbi:MAG TPA: hypothetical protein VK059_11405 [Nocardioidaceae bacterium]|nr:hypothetical protein [Nocardioidaceae bacterium]